MKLCQFLGNLCVGGLSLKNIDVFMDEELVGTPANWSGHIQVSHSQQQSLELERRYLLMLEEDCMSCVKLVSFRQGNDDSTVLADFVVCSHQ